MRQAQETITIQTRRHGNHDITREIADWVERQTLATGLLTIFLQHVSAHLTLQEHADRDDLSTFFRRLEEQPSPDYGEYSSAMAENPLAIPVSQGRMALGARQRIYLHENREAPQRRSIVLHLIGE